MKLVSSFMFASRKLPSCSYGSSFEGSRCRISIWGVGNEFYFGAVSKTVNVSLILNTTCLAKIINLKGTVAFIERPFPNNAVH